MGGHRARRTSTGAWEGGGLKGGGDGVLPDPHPQRRRTAGDNPSHGTRPTGLIGTSFVAAWEGLYNWLVEFIEEAKNMRRRDGQTNLPRAARGHAERRRWSRARLSGQRRRRQLARGRSGTVGLAAVRVGAARARQRRSTAKRHAEGWENAGATSGAAPQTATRNPTTRGDGDRSLASGADARLAGGSRLQAAGHSSARSEDGRDSVHAAGRHSECVECDVTAGGEGSRPQTAKRRRVEAVGGGGTSNADAEAQMSHLGSAEDDAAQEEISRPWASALILFSGPATDTDLASRLRARGMRVVVVDTKVGGRDHDVLRREVADGLEAHIEVAHRGSGRSGRREAVEWREWRAADGDAPRRR
jgi:hypothetical protein